MGYFSRLGPSDSLPQEGVDVQAVIRSLGIGENQVRDEVENLISEGHLYSTTDEDQ